MLKKIKSIKLYLCIYILLIISNYEQLDLNKALDIPVWLRNRLISAGPELVLSYTEKLCISVYFLQNQIQYNKLQF